MKAKELIPILQLNPDEDFDDLIYYIGFNVYTKPVEYEVIGNIYENPELLEEQR
ncbi:YopX family protein [Enterococcus hirae]|uniref:YopX family protein n=1 Tax=Enterococcus hirae TaxID=1354 RepID=UPI000F6D2A30|nr:YopX family protein [Enterococcus hirae]VEE82127.1 YopX protein [Enterococcus hirae]